MSIWFKPTQSSFAFLIVMYIFIPKYNITPSVYTLNSVYIYINGCSFCVLYVLRTHHIRVQLVQAACLAWRGVWFAILKITSDVLYLGTISIYLSKQHREKMFLCKNKLNAIHSQKAPRNYSNKTLSQIHFWFFRDWYYFRRTFLYVIYLWTNP